MASQLKDIPLSTSFVWKEKLYCKIKNDYSLTICFDYSHGLEVVLQSNTQVTPVTISEIFFKKFENEGENK